MENASEQEGTGCSHGSGRLPCKGRKEMGRIRGECCCKLVIQDPVSCSGQVLWQPKCWYVSVRAGALASDHERVVNEGTDHQWRAYPDG